MTSDLSGKKFSRWLVQHRSPRAEYWFCICDCGTVKAVRGANLKNGNSKSCGCYSREIAAAAKFKHGMAAGGRQTPEYATWARMKDRCENPNATGFERYGGRGISVCDEWRNDFCAFLRDMGKKPSSRHSIDRIDVNGDYTPGNCRWATPRQQSRNKSDTRMVMYGGSLIPLIDAAALAGIGYRTINSRMQKGWTAERAVTEPLNLAYSAAQSRTKKLTRLAKEHNISISTVRQRMNRGWDELRALTEPPKRRHAQRHRRVDSAP